MSAGTSLGPYEIVAPLGAGGMGEVYRARDTRLERTVAIKVLPSHLNDNSELKQRFEREARTISGLSHPHICSLYDIGQQDGIDFLVLEYLEGETLEQRLARGALPGDQVLRIGLQIADALDKAHRNGVVHRDLKPGNVMLTKSGAKLLDFGLAKSSEASPVAAALTELTAANRKLTTEGSLVGTFQYMAPEQLEGKEADSRTDIFAFGELLYEMATGRPAFQAKTKASLIAAILSTEPPPISAVQPMSPPALDRLVRTCLAKDPEERLQSARDLKLQLEWIADAGSQAGVPAPVVRKRHRREWGLMALAALSVLVAMAMGWTLLRQPQPLVMRTYVTPPENMNFFMAGSGSGPVAVSPDGRRLVFAAMEANGKSLLWVRPLDSFGAQPLAGTEGASYPFWSPDSRYVGFFSAGKLRKIDAGGGPTTPICDALNGRGGAWSRDGVIVFAPGAGGALSKVAAAGGTPVQVTQLDASRHENTHRWPAFLPDGKHFIFLGVNQGMQTEEGGGIFVGSLDGGAAKFVTYAHSNLEYSQGHILFARQSTLLALPFDERRLAPSGEARPIAEQVQMDAQFNRAVFSASPNGVIAFGIGSSAAMHELAWYDRSGKRLGAVANPNAYTGLRLSPDGKRAVVAIDSNSGNLDLWIVDLARNLPTRLTFDTGAKTNPVWSPDGKMIAFSRSEDLAEKASDGSGTVQVMLHSPQMKNPGDWSRDGRYISYHEVAPGRNMGWVLPLFGDGKPIPVNNDLGASDPQFSLDGRWLVFDSQDSGRTEIYVTPFPGPGGRFQVSNGGGDWPRWSRDASEIFYISPDGKLTAVPIKLQAQTVEIGAAHALFDEHISFSNQSYGYDVAPDGKRFLAITDPEGKAAGVVAVVSDWKSALKK